VRGRPRDIVDGEKRRDRDRSRRHPDEGHDVSMKVRLVGEIADILSLLAGRTLAPPPTGPPPLEALSDSEVRVLRYLPTNLSMRQIGSELYVSHNTVRTHISHVYAKLGTHTRAEAVARARALGLLAPSPLRGKALHAS
jgi:DNA-binding CsgD family transcriptional regulator